MRTKIRSKKLHEYLTQNGVDRSEKIALNRAKHEYRKLYKREWIKNNRVKRREIRFHLDNADLELVKEYCKTHKTTPTNLSRELIMSYCNGIEHFSNKELLRGIYKRFGLTINRFNPLDNLDDLKKELIGIETELYKLIQL